MTDKTKRDTDIGSLIKAIANAKDAEENRQLRAFGITAPQMHVLLFLYDAEHHERPLKELEKKMYVSQSTMAKMVRNLVEEKGLARYTEDPDDRRVKKVQLTSAALPLCRNAEHVVSEMEQQLCAGMSEEEIRTLRRLLQQSYHAVSRQSHT